MGGTRAAVAASIVTAEKEGSGAAGALRLAAAADFQIDDTPYADFIRAYFT